MANEVNSSQKEQLTNLAQKVRGARVMRNLSLREVARRSGLTPSLISQIERGVTCPSVSSLLSISGVLDLPMEYFFDNGSRSNELDNSSIETATSIMLARGVPEQNNIGESVIGGLQPTVSPIGRDVVRINRGVEWHRLTPKYDQTIEFIELRYDIGSSSGEEAHQHRGREYGLVLQGKLLIELGFNKHVLEPGWSISFDCSIPHRLANVGDIPVMGVWVIVDRY